MRALCARMNMPMKPSGTRGALRLAVVTETYPPEINGVARTVGLMVEALLERGHEVQLIRPRQGRERAPSTDQALRERLVAGFAIPFYRHLQIGLASPSMLHKEWSQWRPDLVHVVTEGPLGWAAVSAARRLAIPICSDFHTNFHSYSRHYGFGMFAGAVARYLRALHNRADCTLVPTAQMRANLEALGFERVAVVGRGVDTQLFSPARRSERLRAAWGCRQGDAVALHVGRLAPEKNIGLFVEAALGMHAIDPKLRVVLVGDGPRGPALRTRHPDFVFAGMRSGEDLAEHYASADVFLFPSTTETFGNVTLEAMASGLAVIAYDYAAAQQYLRHGVSGLLAPQGDAGEFVQMAAQLARNRKLRSRFGQQARIAAESASWDRAFDDLERVLRNIAGTVRTEIDGARRDSAHVET
jgi:glycosyltransferase involved in cell wall biosynthesis